MEALLETEHAEPLRALHRRGRDDGQAEPDDGPGVAGVDDPVVVDAPRQEQRQRLGLDLGLDQLPHLGVGGPLAAPAPGRRRGAPRGWPWAAAEPRVTSEITPASCAGPITADLALGQANRKRGS